MINYRAACWFNRACFCGTVGAAVADMDVIRREREGARSRRNHNYTIHLSEEVFLEAQPWPNLLLVGSPEVLRTAVTPSASKSSAVRSALGLLLRFLVTKDTEKFTEAKAAEAAHKDSA